MGTPYACYLSKYTRTIVYEIPGLIVRQADHIAPSSISETLDFRASIVTNPHGYIKDDTFSDQYELDRGLREELNNLVDVNEGKSEKRPYIVIQFEENMGSDPAVDGQCIKTTLVLQPQIESG